MSSAVAVKPSEEFSVPAELTLNDRCDRCGAEALTRVVMPSKNDLLFCGHHTNRWSLELMAQGGVFHRKHVVEHDRLKGSDH